MIDGIWLSSHEMKMLTARHQVVHQSDDEDDDSSDSETIEIARATKKKDIGSTITNIDIEDLIKSEYLPIKGIVALANFRYRVQLNTFQHKGKKFSRNSADLFEVRMKTPVYKIDNVLILFIFVLTKALWIYEICLLISDAPKELEQLILASNYNSLVTLDPEMSCFTNAFEYYIELGRQIMGFMDRNEVFTGELIQFAISVCFHSFSV